MVWFKVDDTLAFHEKCVAAGNPAMGLWVRAGSWCAQQLNDGFVPDHMLAALGTKGQASRLVAVNLWKKETGGYRFHQWGEDGRQPTREEVESKRQEWRDKKRKQRRNGAGQYESSPAVSLGDSPGDSPEESHRPVPSRPDPSITTEMSFEGGSHASRGSETSTPPVFPDRCTRHANDPTPGNCGDCADQRKANAVKPHLSLVADAEFQRPPWCGSCNEFTRLTEPDDGPSRRCTACHPLALEAS